MGKSIIPGHPNALVLQSGGDITFGDGKIGIGTESPGESLHTIGSMIVGTATSVPAGEGIILSLNEANGVSFYFENSSAGGKNWRMLSTGATNDGGAGNYLILNHTDDPSNPVILADGKIGIGTLSPIAGLNVEIDKSFTAGTPHGIYTQNTNTAGQTSLYLENHRGSFTSYGGWLYGGSTGNMTSGNTLFGTVRADRLFMFADGASNLGMFVGTLQAQPLVFGTNNIENVRLASGGEIIGSRESSTQTREAFSFESVDVDATDATRRFRLLFNVYDTAKREGLRITANGSNAEVHIPNKLGIGSSILPPSASLHISSSDLTSSFRVDSDAGGTNVFEVSASGDVNVGGVSGSVGTGRIVAVTGSFQLLEKAAGTFKIPHPDPSKSDKNLYHSFVESPTAGDNLYRFDKIEALSDNAQVILDLPDYYRFLNENKANIQITAIGQFAHAYGSIDKQQKKLVIMCEKKGFYDILIVTTRKDSLAKQYWKGVERDK